ncbi:hypothetical protein BS47DRAFT_45902 [Hydnum rufescens UP504]|uniref:ABC transmembrane type-1 domain-containing protein n=1 Tax=Hydnum rufescens UP504 TaxID=1448309 RepID=A0A9P6AS86_9AGAM|nr:hypothetical protein BS47DRAFT_45902 [Hydnum rufescens UP504]
MDCIWRAIQGFQQTDRHQFRISGDRTGLWFFIISLCASFTIACQNYLAILRQDIGWFDEEAHSTGVLVSNLSDGPQKVYGLAGVTLGSIVQSLSTVTGGIIVGLVYGWKLTLVGFVTMPIVGSVGFIRLRVIVLKDKKNRNIHAGSAQLACEAAGRFGRLHPSRGNRTASRSIPGVSKCPCGM